MQKDQLIRYVCSGDYLVFERCCDSKGHLCGYLVGLSEFFALVLLYDEFAPDGYAIIRLRDIESLNVSDEERFFGSMLRSEGVVTADKQRMDLPLNSTSEAINGVQSRYGRLIVEIEDPDETREQFYIGVVAEVNDRTLRINHFDTMGCWLDEPIEVETRDITCVRFLAPYLETFWKYVEPLP